MELFRNLDIDLVAIGLRVLLAFITVVVGRSLARMTRRGLLKALQKTEPKKSWPGCWLKMNVC